MDAAKFSFLVLVVLYAVLGAELLVAPGIARLGIVPRTQAGLVGIVFSPLLHASLAHLNANAVPLFALLVLLLTNAEYRPVGTLALIWCASGLGTWLIGRGGSVHLGASSIIFGLAAFLIVAGFKAKSWRSVGGGGAGLLPLRRDFLRRAAAGGADFVGGASLRHDRGHLGRDPAAGLSRAAGVRGRAASSGQSAAARCRWSAARRFHPCWMA